MRAFLSLALIVTILNVYVGRDRALVGVDSMALRIDDATGRTTGGPWWMPKMHTLAHAHTVLAGAGDFAFAFCVYSRACAAGAVDLDALEDRMPQILAAAWALYMEDLQDRGISPGEFHERQRVCLVGWSPKLARPAGYMYQQEKRVEGFARVDIGGDEEGWMLQPAPPRQVLVDDGPSMTLLAREQLSQQRRSEPSFVAGGAFWVAEITAAGISLRKEGNLDTQRCALLGG